MIGERDRDRAVWEAIVAESNRRRRRRRRSLVALPAVVVAAATALVVALPSHPGRPTSVASGPRGQASEPLGPDPRNIAGGSIPSLGRLYALPACPGGSADLATWAANSLAPYVTVDRSTGPATMADAAAAVPVPRDAPSPGACSLAVKVGDALAWELRSPSGDLLGRGAGVANPGGSVPDGMRRNPYHQELVASGQPFSGFIDGAHAEAIANHQAVVLDLPAYATSTATDPYQAGLDVLSRLTFSTVAPLDGDVAFKLPSQAPAGYTRCTGDLSFVQRRSGPVADFCNAAGSVITLTWPDPQTGSVPATSSVDVNGLTAGVHSLAGNRLALTVRAPGVWDGPALAVDIEGPLELGANTLAPMLRSIPALDPRVLHPRGGTHDLRPLAMDSDRLRSVLEAAGATAITFPPAGSCGSLVPAQTTTTRCPGAPIVPGITFTLGGDPRAQLITSIAPDGAAPIAPTLFGATGVETVADIDVLEREVGHTAPQRGSGQQAFFTCGKVMWNVIGNQAFDFARRLIPQLGC